MLLRLCVLNCVTMFRYILFVQKMNLYITIGVIIIYVRIKFICKDDVDTHTVRQLV